MSARLRVLIVADEGAHARMIVSELRSAGMVVEFACVEDAPALAAALERDAWDVVLSDWALQRFSALEALSLLQRGGFDLPFILVSGTVGEELAVEAMRAGAHDYVSKDRLSRLVPSVARELREREMRAERRRAEAALRASERRYRTIVETASEGVWVIDAAGLTTFVNARMAQILGCEVERANGRPALELLREESRAVFAQNLPRLHAGLTRQLEVAFLRADGTTVWTLLGSSPLHDESGRFDGVLAMVTDISERKHAEAALSATEEQLRQAQKMEAIGRLAGGIAHDFNNLLSVILGMSELLIGGMGAGEPMRADLEEIQAAGHRAAELTRQLLLFSRQQVVEPRVLDLNDTLAGLDKMLRRLVGEDIDVRIVHGPSLGRVRADPGSVEQVVMNLTVNARDAMSTGGALRIETQNVEVDALHASAHLRVPPGRYVMLAVTDTGSGMDKETQARIFEPFFTTKAPGKGTGLGLSTVFGIVQQCGGGVWVRSEPGHGTTFHVYFPRVDAPADARAAFAPVTPLHGTETILLVEDEDAVRSTLSTMLRHHGYTVLEARSAGEALQTCERHEGDIQLLLSDVVMPRMSGPELARRLVPMRAEMRVLFMSGYTDDRATRHEALASGRPFLQKPVTVDSLSRKVREAIDSRAP